MSTPTPYDLTKPLLAFWVGDDDILAAEDVAHALALVNAMAGSAVWTLDDIELVSTEELDAPLRDEKGRLRWTLDGDEPVSVEMLENRLRNEEGRLAWTLRGLLISQTAPGYLAGYQYWS